MNADQIWEHIMHNPPFVIAEAGKNFIMSKGERSIERYLKNAQWLVDEAVDAGAHAIKFQTHTVEDEQLNIAIESPHFKGGDRYQWVSRNTRVTPFEEFWRPLKDYCEKKGIVFFSTPMSRASAYKLAALDVQLWKVGSADILDFVLLDFLRHTGKPILMSSGMSTIEEVEKAVKFIREVNPRVLVFHCVSRYPCPPEDLRLGTIKYLQNRFPGMPIGFSDHSIGEAGIEADLIAAGMGVNAIEKHFSLARDMYGADHKVSMTPDELVQLMEGVKRMNTDEGFNYTMMNSETARRASAGEDKMIQDEESVFPGIFRKALVAARDIKAGEVITSDMLYAMRPFQYAGGVASDEYMNVLGKKVVHDMKKYDPLTPSCW